MSIYFVRASPSSYVAPGGPWLMLAALAVYVSLRTGGSFYAART
jgi:hypothetical protein